MGRPLPRVRSATPVDRADLADLWMDLIDHHRGLDPEYRVGAGVQSAVLREIERGLSTARCSIRVAEADGQLVGFVFCEQQAAAEMDDPDSCWVHELFVTDDWRARGVGTVLVDAALVFFRSRGGGRLAVRVEERNPGARRFWERQGYSPRARILEREL